MERVRGDKEPLKKSTLATQRFLIPFVSSEVVLAADVSNDTTSSNQNDVIHVQLGYRRRNNERG